MSDENFAQDDGPEAVYSSGALVVEYASAEDCVTLSTQDLLALSIHFASDGDIWSVYKINKDGFERSVKAAVDSYLGPELDSFVILQKGSFWAKVVIRFKSFGSKISSGATETKINLKTIAERVKTAVNNFVSKLSASVKSPKVKATLSTSYNVLKETLPIASSLVTILEFFGFPGAAALGEALKAWVTT